MNEVLRFTSNFEVEGERPIQLPIKIPKGNTRCRRSRVFRRWRRRVFDALKRGKVRTWIKIWSPRSTAP